MVCIIAPTAGQITTRAIACKKFNLIGTRCDRADDDSEHPVAVKIGCDNADLYLGGGCGYTLPCELDATTVSIALGRKLAEGRGKRATEEVKTDLVQLAGRRALQGKGDRQFARRRH